jgi:hypothetical protein
VNREQRNKSGHKSEHQNWRFENQQKNYRNQHDCGENALEQVQRLAPRRF